MASSGALQGTAAWGFPGAGPLGYVLSLCSAAPANSTVSGTSRWFCADKQLPYHRALSGTLPCHYVR